MDINYVNEVKKAVDDLYEVLRHSLGQNADVIFKGVKYTFNQTYFEEDSEKQRIQKIKLTKLILRKYLSDLINISCKQKLCTHTQDCNCNCGYYGNDLFIESIIREGRRPQRKTTFLMPLEPQEKLCIPYNHMTPEEQSKVLTELGIPEGGAALAYPCTNPECIVEEPDFDVEEFIKSVNEQNLAKHKEFDDLMKKLQDEGMEYEAALKQCYKELYGVDI